MITNAPGLVINGLESVDVDTIIAIMIGPAKNIVFKTQLEKSRILAKYLAITPIVFLRNIISLHLMILKFQLARINYQKTTSVNAPGPVKIGLGKTQENLSIVTTTGLQNVHVFLIRMDLSKITVGFRATTVVNSISKKCYLIYITYFAIHGHKSNDLLYINILHF